MSYFRQFIFFISFFVLLLLCLGFDYLKASDTFRQNVVGFNQCVNTDQVNEINLINIFLFLFWYKRNFYRFYCKYYDRFYFLPTSANNLLRVFLQTSRSITRQNLEDAIVEGKSGILPFPLPGYEKCLKFERYSFTSFSLFLIFFSSFFCQNLSQREGNALYTLV